MILFFDTETSGFRNSDWICQLGWTLETRQHVYATECFTIYNEGREMPPEPASIHGITNAISSLGFNEDNVFTIFSQSLKKAELVVCHNYAYDARMLRNNLSNHPLMVAYSELFESIPHICTMKATTEYCRLKKSNGQPKWPKLEELYQHLFNEEFPNAHNALADVNATRRCFWELVDRGVIEYNGE